MEHRKEAILYVISKQESCRLYYWSKDGWVVVGFECMAVVRRIFV